MITAIYPYVPSIILKLPFYGHTVPAGFPSPADDHLDQRLDLNELVIQHPAATFFVTVQGDSMIGAGIHDGDTVIIQRTEVADNGAIVVALVDNEEAGDIAMARWETWGNKHSFDRFQKL